MSTKAQMQQALDGMYATLSKNATKVVLLEREKERLQGEIARLRFQMIELGYLPPSTCTVCEGVYPCAEHNVEP